MSSEGTMSAHAIAPGVRSRDLESMREWAAKDGEGNSKRISNPRKLTARLAALSGGPWVWWGGPVVRAVSIPARASQWTIVTI